MEGKDAAPPEVTEPERKRRKREPSPAAVDLLKTLLRLRAEDAGVAPRLIANTDDIERLAAGEDDGVAALSGTAFGVFGEGYLRFSVANSMENLQLALERLDKWTKQNL